MNICVIGAGIVGCSTAYQLVLQGHKVQLIDAAEGPGLGASLANGAQLSYSYVEPLASPHTLRSLPGMLMSPDSPLRFSLQSDWRQWAWGLQFLTACTQRKVQAGTRTLLQLSQRSQQVLAQWMAQEQWFIDFQRNGKLVLCPDTASLARQRQQIDFQRALGCDQTILSVDECLTREPALQRYRHQFAGAVWTADECITDPHKLCQALLSSTLRKNATASFRTQLQGFVTRGDRVQAVRTSQGEIQADAFVLATGSSVSRHAALLGVYLPVYPIKGYSITVPIRVTANAPKVSVTDLARKTVFAPLDGRLRVAARAEIIGYDLGI